MCDTPENTEVTHDETPHPADAWADSNQQEDARGLIPPADGSTEMFAAGQEGPTRDE
jgi:hypothetical protein